jgi:hypothetical protein
MNYSFEDSSYHEDSSTIESHADKFTPLSNRSTTPPAASLSGTQEHPTLPQTKAQLIVLVGKGAGTTYTIEDELLIGRSLDATVRLNGEEVSRYHARIRQTSQGIFTIEDLGSRNGTLVNGIPTQGQIVLKLGDKIRIGSKTILMFTQYDSLEEQLLQSQKLESIGQLAGAVAHDFNNLLGAILANISFLQSLSPQYTFADQDVRSCLVDIETASKRAIDLTKQLLGFTRRSAYEKQIIDISALLEEVKNLVARAFEKSIQVNDHILPNLHVSGDPSQIHQVLMNLCINARDAMPDGGDLVISAKRVFLTEAEVVSLPFLIPAEYVVISVSDTGLGMDPEILKRAFEPFFTTKGPGKGTGMGLATASTIVKSHGGYIQAESDLGKGSAFKVYLPAANAPYQPGDTIPVEHRTREVKKGIILLADDEEIFRNSARRLLEAIGFTVLSAIDGFEAIETFKQNKDKIDLVLLDIVMPQRGGGETFHELRKIKPSVKVLLQSAYTDLNSVRSLIAAGAQGFLAKPYHAKELSEAISRILLGHGENI